MQTADISPRIFLETVLARCAADLAHKMATGTQNARQRAQLAALLAALPPDYRQQLLDSLGLALVEAPSATTRSYLVVDLLRAQGSNHPGEAVFVAPRVLQGPAPRPPRLRSR